MKKNRIFCGLAVKSDSDYFLEIISRQQQIVAPSQELKLITLCKHLALLEKTFKRKMKQISLIKTRWKDEFLESYFFFLFWVTRKKIRKHF
jgi:hypothetical protein